MRLFIVILVVGLLIYLMSRKSQTSWMRENKWKLIGGCTAFGILALVLTGKLHWFAAIAAPLAAFGRKLWSFRGVLLMFPRIRQILGLGTAAGGAGAAFGRDRQSGHNGEPMTVKRACEILGVAEHASVREIRAAHRKLMGKMHPDKDGSDYLAALVNEARDYLISRQDEVQ